MYLVDTSIWIGLFRKQHHHAVEYFKDILDQGHPFGITGIIYQEVLQGVSSEKEFFQLSDYLKLQKFYHVFDPIASYLNAAKLYFDCRKKGVTPRSSIDCLIAQIAIEHHLILLHHDRDFIQIQKVVPKLKLYPSP